MTKIHLMILISYSKFNIILPLTSRHKKTWDFFLITILRSWNYLTHLISKAHEIIVSVYCFTLMCFLKCSKFQNSKYKQKRFYVVLKFTQSKLSFFFFYHRHNFSSLIFLLTKVKQIS